MFWLRGLRPNPAGRAYSAPPDPVAEDQIIQTHRILLTKEFEINWHIIISFCFVAVKVD